MYREIFKFIAGVMFVLSITFFSPAASAEVKIYTGVGEYYMESETETLGYAQEQAKILAQLDALKQAQTFIESYSQVNNFALTDDEIISVSAGILQVTDVKYSIAADFDGTLIMKAVVTAGIDEDKISELLKRAVQSRGKTNG